MENGSGKDGLALSTVGDDCDEESEDSTSKSELETFRQQWEAELKKTGAATPAANSAVNLITATPASRGNPYPNPTSMAGAVSISKGDAVEDAGKDNVEVPGTGTIEEQARRWFLQGIGFERHGDLYDAVRCYRRAIQIDSDIEYKISQGIVEGGSGMEGGIDDSDEEEEYEAGFVNEEEEDNIEDAVLIKRFLKQFEQKGWVLFEKGVENDKAHFSDFPVEVLFYMMRWVVSSDLDVRSIDILSSVSKGFYCITRDDKLWQMVCERVWNSCVLDSTIYVSYRDMFLRRPRTRLDGCYISKITYIRPGEHSFQDQFYRPWHFVEYFRYIRFFSDGKLLFLTTSETPTGSLPGLKDRNPRNQDTLKGKYELYGSNCISAVVYKSTPVVGSNLKHKRSETQQTTSFHLEFQIVPVKNRQNWMLKWTHHAVFITKTTGFNAKNARNVQNVSNASVTSTAFELSPSKYPPMLFSRVKSYTGKSERILK